VRNGDQILRIEHACAQERDGHGRLESGLAWTRGVRNDRDKSAVGVLSGDMLTTSAGRTFAAMPRSTNQTSPRRGDVIQAARDDRVR
jgi:hypothetical protein